MRTLLALTIAATGALTACDKPGFDPPDRAARVQEAELAYSPAMFDTIDWQSDVEKLTTGNQVYIVHCRNCHGPLGEGDTPYARSRDLEVRSLVEPDWEYAGDIVAVRRRIFTGHPAGMYTWGIAGISPREIDAVAHYIVERLRPDAPLSINGP